MDDPFYLLNKFNFPNFSSKEDTAYITNKYYLHHFHSIHMNKHKQPTSMQSSRDSSHLTFVHS